MACFDFSSVVAGLVPAIHDFLFKKQGVDARHKVYTRAGRRPDPGAGHDSGDSIRAENALEAHVVETSESR
jgi:hypothetical protein